MSQAADGRAAVDLATELRPDAMVMDIAMSGFNEFETTRRIHALCPKTEVLALTMVESEELIHKVLAAGARGDLLKSDVGVSVLAAVEALATHKPFFNVDISEKILQDYLRGGAGDGARGHAAAGDPLTPHEREIVQAIAEARYNKKMSRRFGISVKTVEAHRASVMRKIDAHSVSDVARYAARNNTTFG